MTNSVGNKPLVLTSGQQAYDLMFGDDNRRLTHLAKQKYLDQSKAQGDNAIVAFFKRNLFVRFISSPHTTKNIEHTDKALQAVHVAIGDLSDLQAAGRTYKTSIAHNQLDEALARYYDVNKVKYSLVANGSDNSGAFALQALVLKINAYTKGVAGTEILNRSKTEVLLSTELLNRLTAIALSDQIGAVISKTNIPSPKLIANEVISIAASLGIPAKVVSEHFANALISKATQFKNVAALAPKVMDSKMKGFEELIEKAFEKAFLPLRLADEKQDEVDVAALLAVNGKVTDLQKKLDVANATKISIEDEVNNQTVDQRVASRKKLQGDNRDGDINAAYQAVLVAQKDVPDTLLAGLNFDYTASEFAEGSNDKDLKGTPFATAATKIASLDAADRAKATAALENFQTAFIALVKTKIHEKVLNEAINNNSPVTPNTIAADRARLAGEIAVFRADMSAINAKVEERNKQLAEKKVELRAQIVQTLSNNNPSVEIVDTLKFLELMNPSTAKPKTIGAPTQLEALIEAGIEPLRGLGEEERRAQITAMIEAATFNELTARKDAGEDFEVVPAAKDVQAQIDAEPVVVATPAAPSVPVAEQVRAYLKGLNRLLPETSMNKIIDMVARAPINEASISSNPASVVAKAAPVVVVADPAAPAVAKVSKVRGFFGGFFDRIAGTFNAASA